MIAVLLSALLMAPPSGMYRIALETPGGELPFRVQLASHGNHWHATIHNPPETIKIPRVQVRGNQLVLNMPHYDSRMRLQWTGAELVGTWRKQRGSEVAELQVTGTLDAPRFPPGPKASEGWATRWKTKFADSDDPAVLELQVAADGTAQATFLTTTGDYRYLSGQVRGEVLELSCFDGAHAFLFRAERKDGKLHGDFWSGAHWHETWTAEPDADFQLPSAFEQTKWREADLSQLRFPDLNGIMRSLDEPTLRGKVTILEIFGSWCPNCHDAGQLLARFEQDYGRKGLKIVGLAFELTGTFARDARQVRTYMQRHKLNFPVLIAGTADKAEASKRLPIVDRIRSYPTLILLDQKGTCRAIYTGWTGPATGAAYERLQSDLRRRIEELLAE